MVQNLVHTQQQLDNQCSIFIKGIGFYLHFILTVLVWVFEVAEVAEDEILAVAVDVEEVLVVEDEVAGVAGDLWTMDLPPKYAVRIY